MIILDTNVISALMRDPADAAVIGWLDRQPRTSIWTTSITLLELYYGLQIMPAGRKRSTLMQRFETLVSQKLERRVAAFDTAAAGHSAGIMAARKKAGRPVELRDTMIAGIALASNASLATRNKSHFGYLPISVVNPWSARS
jgi:hypothetical protein